MPCSFLEYRGDLEDVFGERANFTITDEEELSLKVKTRYRALVCKHVGKLYVKKCMPSNDQIPICAQAGIRKIVQSELGGYDSLLDFSPISRDKKLNKLDNQREMEQIGRCSTGGQTALTYESSSDEEEF